MSENKLGISRNAMNYGGMTGIVWFLFFVLSTLLGTSTSGIIQFVQYFVLALGIFIGTKHYRDNELQGIIPYSTAFYSGFLISFFCSVIVSFTFFLYVKFVDSSILEKIIETAKEDIYKRDQDISDEDAERAISLMARFMTPAFMAITVLVSNTIAGSLMSLLTAAFLKKEKPDSGDSFNNFIQQNK